MDNFFLLVGGGRPSHSGEVRNNLIVNGRLKLPGSEDLKVAGNRMIAPKALGKEGQLTQMFHREFAAFVLLKEGILSGRNVEDETQLRS